MLNLKANEVRFQIPQSWGDINLYQYFAIKAKGVSIIDIVSALINFKSDSSSIKIDLEFAEAMIPYLDWLKSPINLDGVNNVYHVDIKEKTIGQLFLLEQKTTNDKIKQAFDIYHPEENIRTINLYHAIVFANDVYKQLDDYHKQEKDQLFFRQTDEQSRAGIDKFNQFGRLNTIDLLSNGDILNYEKVLMIDVNSIFAKLKRIKVENDYQRNYSKIMADKK